MRYGRTSNLAFGNRTLKFDTKLGSTEQIEELFKLAAQNFSQSVRNESMVDAINYMEARAVHYIREGKRQSKVPSDNPRSQGLEESFKAVFKEGDKVKVSMGEGIPYAQLHNQPKGTTTTIFATNYPMMIFKWYRLQPAKVVAAHSVEKPGIGYWDRALEDVRNKMNSIIQKNINLLLSKGDFIQKGTGAQLRGPQRTFKRHQTAGQRINKI